MKLTELLFCTELTCAITVEPDVPPVVVEPEEEAAAGLALPLSAMLPVSSMQTATHPDQNDNTCATYQHTP